MFKRKTFLQNLLNFASKIVKKWLFFWPKCRLLRQGPMIFYLFLFSETPKNFLKYITRRFFMHIIFINLCELFYLKKVIF